MDWNDFSEEKKKEIREKIRKKKLGKKFTSGHKEKISLSHKGMKKPWASKNNSKRVGENNPNWKGDKIGYAGIHLWIRRNKPKPEFCEDCKENKPFEVANISGEYKRDINDFRWLCRKCHRNFDLDKKSK